MYYLWIGRVVGEKRLLKPSHATVICTCGTASIWVVNMSSLMVFSNQPLIRWFKRVFQGQYPPILSKNNVTIDKDLEKPQPHLY